MLSRDRSRSLARASLALTQWLPPYIVVGDHQQIEGTSDCKMNGSAAMQCIEIRNSLFVETDHLGIYNRAAFEACGILHNAGIACRPIGPVHV